MRNRAFWKTLYWSLCCFWTAVSPFHHNRRIDSDDDRSAVMRFLSNGSDFHAGDYGRVLESPIDFSNGDRSPMETDDLRDPAFVGQLVGASALSNFCDVLCNSDFMSVSCEKARLVKAYGAMNGTQLTFRDTSQAVCGATDISNNETHYILPTLYNHCGTSRKTIAGQTIYENQVYLRRTAAVDVSDAIFVNVSCSYANLNKPAEKRESNTQAEQKPIPDSLPFIVDNQDYNTLNVTLRLTLSDKPWSGADTANAWIKYPYAIAVGQRLYAQIQMDQSVVDDDLKAYAKECFFSRYADPHREPRYKILTSGCPALSSVTLHHQKSLPVSRYSRFSFELERIYFDSNFMFFQCKATVCSLRGGREQEGYETCPSSSYCVDRVIDTSRQPTELPYCYVSSGLLRPVIKAPQPDDSTSTCPPCPSTETLKASEKLEKEDVIIVNGITTPSVIAIGVASFFVGLLLMAALWYVHDKTEPKKYLNVKRRNTQRDALSFASYSTPNSSTPMKA